MPGFLSASGYEGTERIGLGDGQWAAVKRCLTSAEAAFVEAAMTSGQLPGRGAGGRLAFAGIDLQAGRTEMVVQSLVAWNVGDPDGTVWPIDAGGELAGRGTQNPYPPGCPRRQSVERLPGPVFGQIWARCDELNSPAGADVP